MKFTVEHGDMAVSYRLIDLHSFVARLLIQYIDCSRYRLFAVSLLITLFQIRDVAHVLKSHFFVTIFSSHNIFVIRTEKVVPLCK